MIMILVFFDFGIYYMYVICDLNDLFGELFCSNNQKFYLNLIMIMDQVDVDIFISFVIVLQMVNEGDLIMIEVEVCVMGINVMGNICVEFYQMFGSCVDFNVEFVVLFEFENINFGECIMVIFFIFVICVQFQEKYVIGVIVDVNDIFFEINEQNNVCLGDNLMIIVGIFCICIEDFFELNNCFVDVQSVFCGVFELVFCVVGMCDFFKMFLFVQGEFVIIINIYVVDKGVFLIKLFDLFGL